MDFSPPTYLQILLTASLPIMGMAYPLCHTLRQSPHSHGSFVWPSRKRPEAEEVDLRGIWQITLHHKELDVKMRAFERSLYDAIHAPSGTRHVDLLIRTGGEQRLSDFLLWESAYAELYFTNVLWPDFTEADLATAVQAFGARDRRYGEVLSNAIGKNGSV